MLILMLHMANFVILPGSSVGTSGRDTAPGSAVGTSGKFSDTDCKFSDIQKHQSEADWYEVWAWAIV